MVYRECLRCKMIFDRKSSFDNHMNRKNPCIVQNQTSNIINSDLNIINFDLNTVNSDLNIINPNSNTINSDSNITNSDSNTINFKILLNTTELDKNILPQQISPTLIESICKIVKQNEIIIKQNDELKKENIKIKKQNKSIKAQLKKNKSTTKKEINIINNNNNYGNIVNVYEHGKENLANISNNIILDAIHNGQGVSHITNIIESIYLNPNLPEYQNIYISDINRQKCMVYNGLKWILTDINKIYDLISRVISFSKDKHDEFVQLYQNNKNIQDKLTIFKKYLNYCDPEYLEELKDEQEELDDQMINLAEIKRCKDLIDKLETNVVKLFYNKKDIILEKKYN